MGQHNLTADLEDFTESRPGIADDGSSTCGSLKQTDTRRISDPNHVGSRDVQGPRLRVVKSSVLGRRQMLDAFEICRPNEILRIQGTSYAKSAIGPPARSLQHKPIERLLPVVTVCSQVPQIPTLRLCFRIIFRGIDRAV